MKRLPKALIYDPYFVTLGGGERVVIEIYNALLKSHDVALGAPELPNRKSLEMFGYSHDLRIEQIKQSEFTDISGRYDLVFYLTNEVPPESKAGKSFLIIQFPFTNLPRKNLLKKLFQKKSLNSYIPLVYSEFVKNWLEKKWELDANILTPPVNISTERVLRKKKEILSVGRFFVDGHSKRQDVLIESYKILPEEIRKQWKLVLIGNLKKVQKDEEYVQELRTQAKGYNIEIIVNADEGILRNHYKTASIYWHAAGFDRGNSPEKAEHFGITTIEAMGFGCIPFAYDDGGQSEILKSVGYLWNSREQLVEQTSELIASNRLASLASDARKESQKYSTKNFHNNIKKLTE